MTLKREEIMAQTEAGKATFFYTLESVSDVTTARRTRYVLGVRLGEEREDVLLPPHFTEKMALDALRLVMEGIVTPCTLKDVAEDL